ncbi:MAG: class I mannose-6-phosphate isomerase [Clostridiales bacterium]|nr:class I mannose-6-phosphate isomerase [Clostridiales bacterium]
MYPIKLNPHFTDYIWGGRKLIEDFGKKSDLDRVAESWELSCHKDGESTIANGDYAGRTLLEYIEEMGRGVLGTNCEKFDDFPILIKLIDAKDNLSVQVHPDDQYGRRVEGDNGKTEMWYVVDCDEGATLLYGFKSEISKEEFSRRIEENTLLEVVNSVKVKKGDVFFIEAGMLHAIGKGIVIAEIQQNSNTTYRIYDYGRIGADGNPRQLHVDKALDVTELAPPIRRSFTDDGKYGELLVECEYFTVRKLTTNTMLNADSASFHAILLLSGNAHIKYGDGETIAIKKGETVFIPAGLGEYEIHSDGEIEALLTTV